MADLSRTGKVGRPPKRKPREERKRAACIRCGRDFVLEDYIKSNSSHVWRITDGRVLICKECLRELFEDAKNRWDEESAVAVICHYLDVPFNLSLYTSLVGKCNDFDIGVYVRMLNGPQYQMSSFAHSMISGELFKNSREIQDGYEERWSSEDQQNKNAVIDVVGHDPFVGYNSNARKFLFSEIVKYFDDDISEDAYKLSVIVQVVINTYQITQCDMELAKLSPSKNGDDIRTLQKLKKDLSDINTKLAQDNEISVKNRSNKDVGKSTLTYLMRDLREKDFKAAEANYYDALRGEGTQWAIDMSNRAILQNTMFDENDKNEMFNAQRLEIQSLQDEVDDLQEENRLLKIELNNITAMGGV